LKLAYLALTVTVLAAASVVTLAQTAPTRGGRRGGAPAPSPANTAPSTVPATRTYELKGNPIWEDTFTADPAPLVVGVTLYVYTGHDEAKGNQQYNMTDWQCFSTKDMKTWTYHGVLLSAVTRNDFKWAKGDAWAAQVIEKNGKFYWYVTAQSISPNCKAIGVAVADSPTGPFKDAIGKPLVVDSMTPGGGWNDIDPTVWTEADGTTWLFWGNGSCFYAKLKPDMISFDGAIQQITPRLQGYVEGPWVYKRADKYYLVYASMKAGNETISYAMADNITGPWTFKGEIVDHAQNSFTTHPGVVEFKGQWYMFYHNGAVKKPIDGGGSFRRSVCVDYMYYNPDGTIKPVVQTKEGVTVPPAN
jgi:arabinoxylan arabinofuranohydrolase